MKKLACEILEVMGEGLGVPNEWAFNKMIKDVDSDSVLRLNHYPPTLHHERDTSISKVGFGEHSDPQILTILTSNDVPGLQISLQDGVWIPISPDPSAFCINVGDALQVTPQRFLLIRHSTEQGKRTELSLCF